MKKGQKVWAHTLQHDSALVGFVVNPEENEDGKFGVQVGDGVHALAFNEPEDGVQKPGTFSKC